MNWEQFRAILWLRWRLTRNQIGRQGPLGAVIAALAGGAMVGVGFLAGIGAAIGGYAMKGVPSYVVMFVLDGAVVGVLFVTVISVLAELQRSESIDLTRLLHLPISLKQVFVLNYFVSLVSLGTVLAVALLGGVSLGFVVSRGFRFILLLPLVAGFVFLYTAWLYCLRGWLLTLMVNPRRRRTIIMWMTAGIILVSQTPQFINIAVQRSVRREREARRTAQSQATTNTALSATNVSAMQAVNTDRAALREAKLKETVALFRRANTFVPVLWLPNGAHALAEGRILPAIWGAAGMFVFGWLGIRRAYGSTLKFYRADEKAKPVALKVTAAATATKPSRNWVEMKLPWLAENTAAMALSQLRSMIRAPEIRMMLGMALFAAIILPAMFLWRGGKALGISEVGKPFIGSGAVVMVLFMLVQVVCNQFGWDRDGFRCLVLLPTPRERLLLGKNLALLPFAVCTALVPIVMVSVLAKLPPLIVLANVLQLIAAFLLFCALGNLASILTPYRIAPGSLKPSKQSWQTSLLLMLVHMSFPLLVSPVFIPPALGLVAGHFGVPFASLVNPACGLVLAAVCAVVYVQTLRPLGRLLQRRETRILRVVTEVME